MIDNEFKNKSVDGLMKIIEESILSYLNKPHKFNLPDEFDINGNKFKLDYIEGDTAYYIVKPKQPIQYINIKLEIAKND